MTNFKQDLELLLSKERLSSYDNDLEQHFKNLKLIAFITPKLATLEICIRNMVDFLLSKEDENWLLNLDDEKVREELNKIATRENIPNLDDLSHHQYISKMTLGIFIRIIRNKGLQNEIFDLRDMDFKKYDKSNSNFYFQGSKKANLRNYHKVDIVLSLVQNIRNRSYHWENLMKTRLEKGTTFPRLTTSFHKTLIGIAPQNIQIFLKDLISKINKDLLDYCEIKLR